MIVRAVVFLYAEFTVTQSICERNYMTEQSAGTEKLLKWHEGSAAGASEEGEEREGCGGGGRGGRRENR